MTTGVVLHDAPRAVPVGDPSLVDRSLTAPSMGGSLTLRVACEARPGDVAGRRAVDRDLQRVAARVERWAARLTRYTVTSDLAALNSDPAAAEASVRPTLAAVLDWAERAADRCPGLVDVTLLDERLAAESGRPAPIVVGSVPWRGRWHLVRRVRGGRVWRREPVRFDLDGVAKGWIADRALAMLRGYPAAMVDADGDIALRLADGVAWDIGIADPRPGGDLLGVFRLDGRAPDGAWGVATSGTSIHRWPDAPDGSPRHHLLDPRTRRPACTDVVQATVVGDTAREAEIVAKAVVIAGSEAGLELLDGPGVRGAMLLLEGGEVVATPQTLEWLA